MVGPVYPALTHHKQVSDARVIRVPVDRRGQLEIIAVVRSHSMLDEAILDVAMLHKSTPGS